jgi:serine/threonine protein kinase
MSGVASQEISLVSLGIPWKGSPKLWHTIPRNLLHSCTIQGNVVDSSGIVLYRLKPIAPLGAGTFGTVDSYRCIKEGDKSESIVAIKRPKYPTVDLFTEALFQWRTHRLMNKYNLGFCIPEVYDIFTFKQTGDVWFSMRPYRAPLLSSWCLANPGRFGELILQIALTLEVIENIFFIDHRDLKVNNIFVVDIPVEIRIVWNGKEINLKFPFHVVYVDFGYACAKGLIDVRDGLPQIDLCPKDGRDIYQILVSIWRIKELRFLLDAKWGSWIRSKINSTLPKSYLNLVESTIDLSWMYSVTDNTSFRAPLCAPALIINDCMTILHLV